MTLTVPCLECKAPRARYGRMSPTSVCRKCRTKKYAKVTWKYAQDTIAAKSERAKKWKEPADRPTMTGLSLGTMTAWGKVEARGMHKGQRYYCFLKDGVSWQVPADTVEHAQ